MGMATREFNESTFSIIGPSDHNPAVSRGKAFWLKRHPLNCIPLLRLDMDRMDDLVDDEIDPVWIRSAYIVAQLTVTRGAAGESVFFLFLFLSLSHALGLGGGMFTDKLGILNGKKRRLDGRSNASVDRHLNKHLC
jgi:hypothetical protein